MLFPNNPARREARLCVTLRRRGYLLRKSRRSVDRGAYIVVDADFNGIVAGLVAGQRFGMDLDDVASWLDAVDA